MNGRGTSQPTHRPTYVSIPGFSTIPSTENPEAVQAQLPTREPCPDLDELPRLGLSQGPFQSSKNTPTTEDQEETVQVPITNRRRASSNIGLQLTERPDTVIQEGRLRPRRSRCRSSLP